MGITYSSLVRASPAEIFAWHERPGALQRLTPPWQHVRVVQEAGTLSGGRTVLRLPAGVLWVAAHDAYRPPHSFSDHLVSLPFPWSHTHRFEAAGEAVTRVTDVVSTPVPARALRPMFAYRHRQLVDDLATQQQMAKLAPGPLSGALP